MSTRRIIGSIAVLAVVFVGCGDAPGGQGTIHVEGESIHFDSVAEMAEASQLIVLGTVVEVGEGKLQPAPETEDFAGTQDLEVSVEVEKVLKGDVSVGEKVAVRWYGYEVNEDGTRGPQLIVEGQMPPAPGERNVWFLIDTSSGQITYGRAVVAFEGRLKVDDDERVHVMGPVDSGAASEIDGMRVNDLNATVSGT